MRHFDWLSTWLLKYEQIRNSKAARVCKRDQLSKYAYSTSSFVGFSTHLTMPHAWHVPCQFTPLPSAARIYLALSLWEFLFATVLRELFCTSSTSVSASARAGLRSICRSWTPFASRHSLFVVELNFNTLNTELQFGNLALETMNDLLKKFSQTLLAWSLQRPRAR